MTGNRLDNRAAVVTGAADGIGEGIARRFAAEGAAVVVADYDDERGPAVARDLRGLGARAEFIRCDVSRREDVIGAVDLCVERFGSVDILVNNAYRGEGPVRIEKKTDERFDEALRMCLFATKWAMERALPHMKAKGWGRVINMASLNGVNAHMGSADYNVAKEAVRAYSRTAAREWAPYGICVNVICPAAVSAAYRRFAEMAPQVAAATAAANPMGRMGDPESDIGGVAAFLASEDARYLTGNTLFVDGGGHINGVPWVPDFGPED
ncbi:short-chain dehydrogenase/reductase SDR (plasmid) [Novosphingobium aromaticivorans DSM 12444]|uniref:Short-chain dehydrogenase/reductase SDR n=1 Tax=Novosphingobium aromaticivorans (strain ATCC 700278 / DSM 12444 / CCUG 56034 / CIP 105152 / NBRC 16084 / F199) TaxID=279238 RepID=A4XF64_NOVAD|nr:SDR family NAD(P)-dependent oxidoreductase [Novosphingobium aromaticivorans]ABP64575.1 short-chain dehydrogenase/reductase SDR [Novosphingobium aromaticivorans DSM 12444]SCY95238.1 NAD(P)-dependent dehydrogenase, short-chain alcohol dehydrogenase family [Novosphingobium aromaticivorans]